MRIIILFLLLTIGACKSTEQVIIDDMASDMTIAFGSCNHQWDPQTIWSEVIQNDPDLWIWTGDIIYADTEDMVEMRKDYEHLKNTTGYRSLIQQCDIIGVWDDHDYGANNAGKEYAKKDSSKILLYDFLEVPKIHPSHNRPGVYQAYDYTFNDQDIKVILLDVRSFQDKPTEPNASLLGAAQWSWLEDILANSTSDIHLIAGGIQFLHTEHIYEKWFNFPAEYNRLLDLLTNDDLKNIVLISGDRHIGEIASQELSNGTTIYEVTSSGLTHSYEKSTESNSLRIGPLIKTINFGIIRINNKTLDIELHDQFNQIVSSHQIILR